MSAGVLVIGDVIDDVLVRPDGPLQHDTDTPSRIERVPGGSAANTASWLAASGTEAALVATVGVADVERCAAELRRHGVTPHLEGSPTRPTGTIVVISQGQHRTMLTDRGANRDTVPAQVTDGLLAAHAHLHVTAHVLTGEDRDDDWRDLLDRARSAGLRRSVAPGSAGLLSGYGADRFRRLVAGVEVLVASESEAALLTGLADPVQAARALSGEHAVVAVTLGWRGALLRSGGDEHFVPSAPAELADTTGAGDAWVAGLIGALCDGAPLQAAGEAAARLAARAVERVGARP